MEGFVYRRHDNENLLPLQKMKFNNKEYSVPINPNAFLQNIYDDWNNQKLF